MELTTNIDNNTKELIKDNKLLINAFKIRLIKRLLMIFNKYKIPFNKEILENTITEYLIVSFKDATIEVAKSYKKVLYKYFDIINEYYNTHSNSKSKIKEVTKLFIDKIYSEKNPILNETISYNFVSALKSKILVYDIYELNKELESRIKDDTNEIIHEVIKNNNTYLIKSMKEILEYVILNEKE